MPGTTGIDFVIYANTGTIAVPIWTKVAGQRGGTLNRSTDSADLTTKDSANWHTETPTIRNWSIDGDGLVVEDDAAFSALETAWLANEQVQVKALMPSGTYYIGMATISDFPIEGPYDAEMTYSISLTGSGALAKT